MSYNLDPQFCNIYFFSESKMSMTKMVLNGTLTGDVYYSGCSYIELKQPCAIYNSYLESTCKGQFEFRDQNNNKALVVTLDIEREYGLECLVICLVCRLNICLVVVFLELQCFSREA